MRPLRVCLSSLITAATFLLAAALPLHAQVVSSGITGVVKDNSGKTVSPAIITAEHTPTGTTYTATTRADGHFNFRSLIVGGPYTLKVSAAGYKASELTELTTQLGSDVDANITLTTDSEVVQLEKLSVEASANDLDSTATGAASVFGAARLAGKPTTQRSLADIISMSPQVTLRATSGDREESQISAVGQNARFNSIMIDGARINDQFGLNMTGVTSFFNPLSLDTIEQLSVAISPYDVRQSGFTGASINAVTKSGTNQFKGSLTYIFTGDHWLGARFQGPDVGGTTTGVIPKLQRTTKTATLGGPIWRNKIFFFTSYEEFERLQAPNNAGFTPNPSEIAAIKTRLAQINQAAGNLNWGEPGGSAINKTTDKKVLAKIDWNISTDHRLTVRYSTTEGVLPQYGSFTATSGARGVNSTPSGAGFAFDSYFYRQERKDKVIAGQLLSQWTPDFKTEIKYSKTKSDQLTPTNSTLPLINLLNIQGISQSGAPTTGIVFLGTEFSRQGNQIFVDTKSYSATGDYFWKNVVFTGGFDREQSEFENLFRSGSYGQFDFNGTTGFSAGTVAAFTRSFYDPAIRPAADLSNFSVTGIFAQAKWEVSPRLSLVGGFRFDSIGSKSRPLFNQRLSTLTGFRNDGTVDGVDTVSPRLGFNFNVDPERTMQIRGGAGRFLGRAPWVLFSNSYNNLGVGTFTVTTAPSSLESYLKTDFNPANPIGAGTDNPALKREVDWTENKIHLPSIWRGNLAVDYRLPFLASIASLEVIQTYSDQSLFITNENLKLASYGADGRPRYSGNPGASNNTATALYTDFLNLYRIRNISTGGSRYITLSLDRPMKNHWSYNLSYTRGRSTDAQIFGSTTAGSQWGRNAVFAQNTVVESRSDYEIKHRIQASFAREFTFVKNWKTLVSFYYEGRSGNPYSYVYSNDVNNEGTQQNDLVSVPTDVNDARFDFSAMTQASRDAYFADIQSSGLSRFAGGYAPRNAFYQPWVNRLDLHLSQEIPLYKPVKLELFADFTNFGSFISKRIFGYQERTTFVDSDTWWRRTYGSASYNAAGKIVPVYAAPSGIVNDNPQSRWRLQVGAKLKF